MFNPPQPLQNNLEYKTLAILVRFEWNLVGMCNLGQVLLTK